MKQYKHEIISIISIICSYGIFPLILWYINYEGISERKVDLLSFVGTLTIIFIWIFVCISLGEFIKKKISK